eukprot:770681-Amphidinium_carterae.1
MVRLLTQGTGIRSTSQPSLALVRQCYDRSMSMRIRSCLRDWNLSGPMVSGLAETPQMDVTSHARVKAV